MSFLYLEIKYAKIIGQQLERGKIKKESPFHFNSRCPVCGDSAKDVRKTRFHILEKGDKLICHCFNCEYSDSFTYFMKEYHPSIHSEYVFERYRQNAHDTPVITTPTVHDNVFTISEEIKAPTTNTFVLDIPYVCDLDKTHPVAQYVASRGLPDYPFQYADRFFTLASKFNDDVDARERDQPRLIIPFFDREGNVFAFQGRDLSGKSQQKYITIIINKKIPKIFGIDRVDFKKPVLLVEGPIDSLFLPNCLASVNASLVSTAKKLATAINKDSLTLIFDNEPRNKTIVDMYADAIKEGYNVVVWPRSCSGIKDINDCVLAGIDPVKIIQSNTYRGLSAQIQFQEWKKI